MKLKEAISIAKDFPNIFRTHQLAFVEKEEISPGVWSFFFKKSDKFHIKAGQHLMVTLPHPHPDNRGTRRFFSPASAPSEDMVQIAIRYFDDKSSSFKRTLFELEPGTLISAQGPIGNFFVSDPAPHKVFIVGGIGITPVRSILTELDIEQKEINATLLYGNKDENFPFKHELDNLALKHIGFEVNYIIEPKLITESDITAAKTSTSEFYISGAPNFVQIFHEKLLKLGIKESAIRYDKFRPMKGGGYV